MRIALDAMGGDFAPGPNIVGAFEAVERIPDLEVLLVGDRPRLEEEIAKVGSLPPKIRIVESEGFVGMEEKPTVAPPDCALVCSSRASSVRELQFVSRRSQVPAS